MGGRRSGTRKGVGRRPTVISLFTCGMGLDIGFQRAGFETVYCNDITPFACNTIRRNRPGIHCDEGDITGISTRMILAGSGLEKGAADVLIGGPPCQSFSTAGKRRGFKDKRGAALLEYIRVIREARPRIFVFENVPGLLSAAKTHVPFYERAGGRRITKSSSYGSLFAEILRNFSTLGGYDFEFSILNSADYGVAQKRRRLVMVGTRTGDAKSLMASIIGSARYSMGGAGGKKPWRTLRDALRGMDDRNVEFLHFPKWGRYLRYVPPGGCWVDIPKRHVRAAMMGAADSNDPKKRGRQGGRTGFYRRLAWNRPSPTLVTSPVMKGSCLCHPREDRPLSVAEYARLQGFPDGWKFMGTTAQKYRMIGEAVPVELGRQIGLSVKRFL